MSTTQEFFETHLPAALASAIDADAEGTLAFAIAGAGNWTVDLKARTVTPTLAPNADFSLRMSTADFEAMAQGALDLEAAVASGRVQAQGDVKLFAAFGIFLEPEAE